MKKLTAGVFTVMLGLVAANADAAVTSQKYVDDAIKGVNATITTTANSLTQEITNVKGILNGDKETEGSIAAQIAAAVAEANDYTDDAVAAEKARAEAAETELDEGLTAEISTRASQIGDLETLTTTNKASAVVAINELVSKDAAQDQKITANEGNITTLQSDVTELKKGGTIADNAVTEAKIADDAVTTDKIKDDAVTTDKLADVTTAGTGTKVTYNAKGQITGSEALTAADIPTLTADKISNLNALASAELPASCNQPGADCVLKFNGTTYLWEDIADTYTAPTTGGAE